MITRFEKGGEMAAKSISDELMQDLLAQEFICLRSGRAEDLIPHQVFSHGFMKYRSLLGQCFPGFAWRGSETELQNNRVLARSFFRFVYWRFCLELKSALEKAQVVISDKDWRRFVREGWKEYPND